MVANASRDFRHQWYLVPDLHPGRRIYERSASIRKRFENGTGCRPRGMGRCASHDSRKTGTEIRGNPVSRKRNARSEEHTSELQSQSNLVCRLLLVKKTL